MHDLKTLRYFLGGQDLEMQTIRDLLRNHDANYHDKGLRWGANASTYADEIKECLNAGDTPVLIELDLDIPSAMVEKSIVVDHHNDQSGPNAPTSLEQIFSLLKLPASQWTRYFALVAANDRGHIRAMRQLSPPASDEEIHQTRNADLAAQGVQPSDITRAREDAAKATVSCDGRLTVVHTTSRAGLVAETLDPFYGSPGFHNLLVLTPEQATLYGTERCVRHLAKLSPKPPAAWYGVSSSESGYWGGYRSELSFDPLEELSSLLASSESSASSGTS